MHTLSHYRLCPLSRSIRLVLGELEMDVELEDVTPWKLDAAFLSMNPAGELPVLQVVSGPILCGVYSISEYVADELKRHPIDGLSVPLFPGNREERAEVRRLVDWAHGKLNREVTAELLQEKVYARLKPGPPPPPSPHILRALRANLRYHMSYFGYLAHGRRWLAGEDMSFADLAAAAHLSVIDYLGEVPWEEYPITRDWYARLKSRKSFQSLLSDRQPGFAPAAHYANLDF
ncbi:MAG: glutathione S-transferase family protein [Pseudomonadota bacterium]